MDDIDQEKGLEGNQCKMCGQNPGEDGVCTKCELCSNCCTCGEV